MMTTTQILADNESKFQQYVAFHEQGIEMLFQAKSGISEYRRSKLDIRRGIAANVDRGATEPRVHCHSRRVDKSSRCVESPGYIVGSTASVYSVATFESGKTKKHDWLLEHRLVSVAL